MSQIQSVPSWTGHQKIISLKVTSPTTIGNCRPMLAAPTDIQVGYNMMGNMKKILINLGQPDPCVTVDEAIYQRAKQVHWIVLSLGYVTLRLGRFHRAKHFCGIIEKDMRANGFQNIITASKLYASNQIEGTHFSFVMENFLYLIFQP